MHFAWKDENFLIKILTFIMIFIFIVMIAISPVFASDSQKSITLYNKILDKEITIEVDSEVFKYEYYYIVDNSSGPNITYQFVVSDNPITFKTGSPVVWYTKGNTHYYNLAFVSSGSSYVMKFTPLSNSFNSHSVYSSEEYSGHGGGLSDTIVYSTFDVYEYDEINDCISDNLVFSNSVSTNPFFITTDDELCSGKFDLLKIDMGDLDTLDDKIVFNIYDNYDMGDGVYANYPNKSFMLDSQSKYQYISNLNVYYHIPRDELGIDISNEKRYTFEIASYDGETIYNTVTFEIGGLTLEEEIKNEQDEQTEAIKENTETNKGIWETIKDILSYINPFSENFFVYKLIELLVDAIKSLFIPSDNFFSTYFTNLQNWFSDRLGFLFYPFELIIDILNQILNINFSEPQFNIPDIYEPFTGKKLISSTTFNFNDLLDNSVLNTVHNIYLILVDVAIVFGLVNLFHRKYEEVTTK